MNWGEIFNLEYFVSEEIGNRDYLVVPLKVICLIILICLIIFLYKKINITFENIKSFKYALAFIEANLKFDLVFLLGLNLEFRTDERYIAFRRVEEYEIVQEFYELVQNVKKTGITPAHFSVAPSNIISLPFSPLELDDVRFGLELHNKSREDILNLEIKY